MPQPKKKQQGGETSGVAARTGRRLTRIARAIMVLADREKPTDEQKHDNNQQKTHNLNPIVMVDVGEKKKRKWT
jgi:hypothetical protein